MTVAYQCYHHGPNAPQVQCLISSIRRFDSESLIVVISEDDCAAETLPKLQRWPSVEQVLMSELEKECAPTLPWGSVRGKRSPRDTAWTAQSCMPWWMMRRSMADMIVYLDSDTYFFDDIRRYVERLPRESHVGLCPHHYPPGRENKTAGVYNNGVCSWRNTNVSLKIAREWGLEAISRWEPHEQILLDAWPERYGDAIAEFPLGVDAGPWNTDCEIAIGNGESWIDGQPYILPNGEMPPVNEIKNYMLQSFHFHEWRLDQAGKNPVTIKGRVCNRSGYPLHPAMVASVYEPYERELEKYL